MNKSSRDKKRGKKLRLGFMLCSSKFLSLFFGIGHMYLWFTTGLIARSSGKYYLLTTLLHYWRLVMPNDLEIYFTEKFDKDILIYDSLNYIKRPCAGNKDVTFTINIPCKQLEDIQDKNKNIYSLVICMRYLQCHKFLAMLYMFFIVLLGSSVSCVYNMAIPWL